MAIPEPRIGDVVRYSFLWSHEAKSGREEGRKDRPAAIVLHKDKDDGATKVWVVPITHTPPDTGDVAIQIPQSVCRELGLDGDRQWLVVNQLNRFTWPGFDLRPVPGRKDNFIYGRLPKELFEQTRSLLRRLLADRKANLIDRDTN